MTPDAFTAALAERLRQRGVDFRAADLQAFAAGLPPQLDDPPDLETLATRFIDANRGRIAPNEAAILWKVAWRLLPFLFLLYVFNIIDRTNISVARLQMVPALMREEEYALGAGIFYVGYVLFEVPSNLMLRRTGARVWISRILLSWGFVSASMAIVKGPELFYVLRILLGVAEAGFFPGIILYLSYWFPARERARAIALFMVGGPVAGIVGYPLSMAVLQFMDGFGGLAGSQWVFLLEGPVAGIVGYPLSMAVLQFMVGTGGLAGSQWVFLLEGLPAVILGIVTLYYLTDRPAQAKWLTLPERTWLAERMEQEEKQRHDRHGVTFLGAMTDPRVWLLIAVYFTVAVADNAFGFYLPKLLDDRFAGWPRWQLGWLAAVPSVAAVVGMVCFGMSSDRTGERRGHVAVAAFVGAVGWTIVAVAPSPWLFLLGLAVASVGMKSMLPTFWTLPTTFLTGAAAAGGIALINSVANVGGFFGPNVMGQVQARTGSFAGASLFMAVMLCVGGSLVFLVRRDRAGEVVRDPSNPG